MSFRVCGAILALILFSATHSGAQAVRHVWSDVSERAVVNAKTRSSNRGARNVVPNFYRTLRLDRAALETQLQSVPREFSVPMEISSEVEIPLPDGSVQRFHLQESPIMEPELAAKFPEIKTYVGQGIDDPTATMRMDLTPRGFHAIIQSATGSIYIDPYWRDDDTTYVSYFKKDFNSDEPFQCLVESDAKQKELPATSAAVAQRPTGATLRKYRLALACTGEYAVAVCDPNPPTVSNTLAAMVTSVNRCSAIYEREFAIRFLLVANDDKLIYLNGTTDPYTNDSGSTMLGQNQSNINSVIGTANYDIGHVFSTGGGGVAGLGVVCSSSKARGVTGQGNPTGDPFDVDYVVHEMGHQFRGSHPFNATSGNCNDNNRNPITAYEIGSGTTIMAYAGICSPQNIAPNSDDYFHTVNYDEIDSFTSSGSGSSCPQTQSTGNTPPVIAALSAYTIPSQTPFALSASAIDADGDTLTYCWEEFDLGPAQDPTADPRDNGSSTLFRSFPPTKNPTRLFPSLSYILNNANIPPASLTASIASGEFLPTTSRVMTYRVTVRDNRAGGGGSNYASTTVTSNSAAGPFAITAPNSAATLAGGSTQTVTWNVASSDLAPVNCANVTISLSTDDGNSFPIVLANSVPNNGSADVVIPNTSNVATTQGRIKVEAVGNIFFDVSDANLTITSDAPPPTLNVTGDITIVRGTPTAVVATVGAASSVNNPISVSVADVPYGVTITPSITSGSITLSGLADCRVVTTASSRKYPITLTVTDGVGSTASSAVNVVILPNPTPTLGSYAITSVVRASVMVASPNAGPADANNDLAAAPFLVSPTVVPGGGSLSINQSTGAVTISVTDSSTLGAFPVRVSLSDTCGATAIRDFTVNIVTTAANYLASFGLSGDDALLPADPDWDGIPNLMEYALNSNPALNGRAALPVITIKNYSGTSYLSLTFKRSAAATDLTYTVQATSDFVTWTDLATSTSGAATSGPGFVGETGTAPSFLVEVRDTVPVADEPRFMRLQISLP